MLVSQFMEISDREISTKSLWRLTLFMGGLGILLLFGSPGFRDFWKFNGFDPYLFWMYKYFIKNWALTFQNHF